MNYYNSIYSQIISVFFLSFIAISLNAFLVIGHRGACGYEPENTLFSFKKAIELGVDIIEFDVWKCASGELVVIHDNRVDRMTDGLGYVEQKTLQELKELFINGNQKILTLQEVLNYIDCRAKVNIELKGVGTAYPTAQVVKEYVEVHGWSYDNFIISSFNEHESCYFKRLCPEVALILVTGGVPLNYAQYAEQLGATYIVVFKEFITQEFVDDIHKRGMKIFAAIVNDYQESMRVQQFGIDGIFSDYPDVL